MVLAMKLAVPETRHLPPNRSHVCGVKRTWLPIGAVLGAAIALASCSRAPSANAVLVTIMNRRPEPQKVELILQSTEPEKELQKVTGEVAANYSEQFTLRKDSAESGTLKLVVRTKAGDSVTILLDPSVQIVTRTIELTRDRKAVVSEN